MRMFFIVGCFTIAGCSTFTTELNSTIVSGSTTAGLTYRLPAKQFSLTTTYQITGCQVINNKVRFDADIKASLSERLVGDDAYIINYSELNAWTKITNTEIRLSEAGLLTGINTSIADQTSAVIQNSVATVTGIARAISLPATQLIQKQVEQLANDNLDKATEKLLSMQDVIIKNVGVLPVILPSDKAKLTKQEAMVVLGNLIDQIPQSCESVADLLSVYTNAKNNLKSEQAKDKARGSAARKKNEAEAEIVRLSSLKDVYEALGKDKEKNALMARIQQQEKLQAEAVSELRKLGTSDSEKAITALFNATAALTITTTEDILPQKSGEVLQVAITNRDVPLTLSESISFNILTTALPKVTLKINALVATGIDTQPTEGNTGVAYRIPVAAIARVQCECTDGARLLIEQSTQVPQFGPIGKLNLRNGAFANNTLEVAFNAATGAPEKLVFHSQSRAEAASASARDAANAYLQLQKDKRDDIIAANKVTIDQQNALLTLEKSRNEVSLAGKQADATAALLPIKTEQSIVAAQVDLLRDQQRLDAVRTGTASAAETQLEALINQQKLLEQQLKILQIEQQIAEQKALATVRP